MQLQYVTGGVQGAVLTIVTDEKVILEDAATGSGSIEAIYNTISRLLGQEVELTDYRIQSITNGKDAQAEVHVAVKAQNGELYHGIGIDFDVLNASAKAYLQACSKVKEQTEKRGIN